VTRGDIKPAGAHVLCPVRGAKRSLETVARAIDLAIETGAKLTFLFVADVDFLGYATVARVKVMLDELEETGQFTLTFVSKQANDRGVEDVDTLVRQGSIRDVVTEVVREIGATMVVLGRPMRTPAGGFSKSDFDEFIEAIESETGVRVDRVE
jgi:nucleotide-binding universal stress UspA family protein